MTHTNIVENSECGPLGLHFDKPLTRRQLLEFAGVGVGTAALLSACGSSGHSSGAVRSGGTLRLAFSDAKASESLDPALSFTGNDSVYCGAIYESLCSTDTKWDVMAALATSRKPNADATQWTINLRHGVQWHDGSPFTANDVVFSVRRWLDKALGSSMYARLSPSLDAGGITPPDPHTVALKLKRPDALLPVAFALRNAKITKAGTTKFTNETAIGTGAFRLISWTPFRSWSVRKNPHYWQKGLPYLDGVQAVVIPDSGTKLQSVTSGESDVGDPVDTSSWPSVASSSSVELVKLDNRQCWVVILDQRFKPFADPRVVEAVKLAVDHQKLLNVVFQGQGTVTADVTVPASSPFYPSGLAPKVDLGKSKALLAAAGYSNGLNIELNTSAAAAGMIELGQAFQQMMKPAGINVKLKQWPTTSYWNDAWMQTPVFQDYWNHRHPADMLELFYTKGATWNMAHHSDNRSADLINKVFRTTDPVEQKTAIEDAYRYLASTFKYLIPVFSGSGWVQKKNVHGLELNYTDYAALTRVYRS